MLSNKMLLKLIKINTKLPLKTSTIPLSEITSSDNQSTESEKTQDQFPNNTLEISTKPTIMPKMLLSPSLVTLTTNKSLPQSKKLSLDYKPHHNNNQLTANNLTSPHLPYSLEMMKCITLTSESLSKPHQSKIQNILL